MTAVLTSALNPTVDITWEIDRLQSSGKNRARPRGVVAGGGGINVVRGVRKLGGSATAMFRPDDVTSLLPDVDVGSRS